MNAALLAHAADALLNPHRSPPPAHGDRRGFDVHRNTSMTTLADALGDGAPITRAVVGEACFGAIARERVRRDPPRSPVLAEYVAGLGDFIDASMPMAGLPWLGDLARFESLVVQAYHAGDATPLSSAAWQCLQRHADTLQAARLVLHPACRWVRSHYAVGSLWLAHHQDDVDAALAAIDIDHPEAVLVTRPAFDVQVRVLPPAGADLLDALAAGHAIGDAFAMVIAADARADAGDLFSLLLTAQVGISLQHLETGPHA